MFPLLILLIVPCCRSRAEDLDADEQGGADPARHPAAGRHGGGRDLAAAGLLLPPRLAQTEPTSACQQQQIR